MIIAQFFIEENFSIQKVLGYCNLSKSSYYYKSNGKKQGRKPYANVNDKVGNGMSIQQIVDIIKSLLENPFVDYGYFKMWVFLTIEKQIKIGRDTLYKIMKENRLLNTTQNQKAKYGIRNRAEAMVPDPKTAFSFWEFDIKYVWVQDKQRNAQILTIIDVYSRWIIG